MSFPPALAPYFIRKGSVAVDGVSLTVAGLGEKQFDVQIDSVHVDAHDVRRRCKTGDKVNLECDMIGKYVVRAHGADGAGAAARGSAEARKR